MKLYIPIIILSLTVSACGGGSSSNGEALLNTGGETNYTGATTRATITEDNANLFAYAIFGSETPVPLANRSLGLDTVQESHLSAPITNPIKLISSHAVTTDVYINESRYNFQRRSNAQPINNSIECAYSGNKLYTGNLNEDGTGTLNIQFTQCSDGKETLNGQLEAEISKTSTTIDVPHISIKSNQYDVELSGNILIETSYSPYKETTVSNITLLNKLNSHLFKTENLTFETSATNNQLFDTISGRVYSKNHGFVDIKTTTPFAFYFGSPLSYSGGNLVIEGKNESKATIIAASPQRVRIEITQPHSHAKVMIYYWNAIDGEQAPNTPPLVDNLSFHQSVAYTDTNLTIDLSSLNDIDGDPINTEILWYKNGEVLLGETAPNLPATHFEKHDTITCNVIANDGKNSSEKEITLTVLNTPPVLNIGENQNIVFGNHPTLNASGSYDLDNDPLSYTWEVKDKPFFAITHFSDNADANPLFSADEQGEYVISLTVDDGEASTQSQLTVTIDPAPLFQPYQSIPIDQGGTSEAVAVGDINSDGLNDVVLTGSSAFDSKYNTSVFVFEQNSNGSLSSPKRYETDMPPTHYQIKSVDIADMNNDARNDVIISHNKGIGVFLQNSNGNLDALVSYEGSKSNWPTTLRVRAADMNNDSLADIVGIYWGSNSKNVDVYLQNEQGTLNPPDVYLSNHNGYDDLDLGDINNDGLNDIVIADGQNSSNNLSILIQQPDHSFGPAVNYKTGENTSSNGVGIGDFNSDGKQDVALSIGGNSSSAKIAIFKQNNSGSLESPELLRSYDIPQNIIVSDIDGNGREDIVVLHRGWFALGVYLQQTDGSMLPEQRYPFIYGGTNTQSVAVGDINGDGKNDIVAASGGLKVMYNQSH